MSTKKRNGLIEEFNIIRSAWDDNQSYTYNFPITYTTDKISIIGISGNTSYTGGNTGGVIALKPLDTSTFSLSTSIWITKAVSWHSKGY